MTPGEQSSECPSSPAAAPYVMPIKTGDLGMPMISCGQDGQMDKVGGICSGDAAGDALGMLLGMLCQRNDGLDHVSWVFL